MQSPLASIAAPTVLVILLAACRQDRHEGTADAGDAIELAAEGSKQFLLLSRQFLAKKIPSHAGPVSPHIPLLPWGSPR